MKIKRISIMFALSFIAMFITAYATVYSFDHILFSLNKFYMAALMAGSMGIVNVIVMKSMYNDNRSWFGVLGISILVIAASYSFIRFQTLVNNKRFLGSMIPHHSAAILVCEKAQITDPEIIELCEDIVETQREEIEIMKEIKQKY